MSTQSTLETDAIPAVLAAWSRLSFHGDAVELQAGTSGSGSDGVVVLRIKVDDLAAHEEVLAQLRGTRHAVLLVGGGHHLQRTVHNVVALQHGQRHGETDAVVGTQ